MKVLERIEKRQSMRSYIRKELGRTEIAEAEAYFHKCRRLIPSIEVEFMIFTGDTYEKLNGMIGYQGNAFNAPAYLVILSEKADYYYENSGYIAEDIILKLCELDLENCFITVNDSDKVKEILSIQSDKEVTTVIAFGQAKKEKNFFRIDILSPSNVKVKEREGHIAPKIAQSELVFDGKWGVPVDWEEGMIDPVLDEAFYAASLAPSFLNLQPYRFINQGHRILILTKKDDMVSDEDEKLGLGATLLNFYAVYSDYNPAANRWVMGAPKDVSELGEPEDYHVVASLSI